MNSQKLVNTKEEITSLKDEEKLIWIEQEKDINNEVGDLIINFYEGKNEMNADLKIFLEKLDILNAKKLDIFKEKNTLAYDAALINAVALGMDDDYSEKLITIIPILIERNANADYRNDVSNNWNVLHYAAGMNNFKGMAALLETLNTKHGRGSDKFQAIINASNKLEDQNVHPKDDTPLITAARSNCIEMIILLLEYGANPHHLVFTKDFLDTLTPASYTKLINLVVAEGKQRVLEMIFDRLIVKEVGLPDDVCEDVKKEFEKFKLKPGRRASINTLFSTVGLSTVGMFSENSSLTINENSSPITTNENSPPVTITPRRKRSYEHMKITTFPNIAVEANNDEESKLTSSDEECKSGPEKVQKISNNPEKPSSAIPFKQTNQQ